MDRFNSTILSFFHPGCGLLARLRVRWDFSVHGKLLYCLSRGHVCLEKCLILQRTIEKISYKKDVLEVIVSLKDRTIIRVENNFFMKSRKRVMQRREGDVNPAAPACTPSSTDNNGAPVLIPSNFTLILPHDLTVRRYTKKTERYHKKTHPNLKASV